MAKKLLLGDNDIRPLDKSPYKIIDQVLKTNKGVKFKTGQKIAVKIDNNPLPKGDNKAFLVTGPKKAKYTRGDAKKLVSEFKALKEKHSKVILTHDFDDNNDTSKFVKKVAKTYNIPTGKDRSVQTYDKKRGAEVRSESRRQGIKAGVVKHAQYNKGRELVPVDPDQHLQDKWRLSHQATKKETVNGKLVHRKVSGIGKGTQENKAIVSTIGKIRDYAEDTPEFKAGVRWVKKYNDELIKRLGNKSGPATSFLKEFNTDSGDIIRNPSVAPEGKAFRKDIGVDTKYIEDFNLDSTGAGTDKSPKNSKSAGTLLTAKANPKPPQPTNANGPNTYPKNASFDPLSEGALPDESEQKKLQRQALHDTKVDEIELPDDKAKGSGSQTHKGSYLERKEAEFSTDMANLETAAKKHQRHRVLSESEAVPPRARERHKSIITSLNEQHAKFPDALKTEQKKIYSNKKLETKIRGAKLGKYIGGFFLGGIISSLFSRSNLQAKGIKQPSSKQLAQQVAADYIGSPRVLGGVGEEKGYLQKVGLTKKGVSGKRRASGPIKGAGGENTPYASISRFFSSSKKNAFNKRPRN